MEKMATRFVFYIWIHQMDINILTTNKNGLMNMLGCLFVRGSLWEYSSWDHFLQGLRSHCWSNSLGCLFPRGLHVTQTNRFLQSGPGCRNRAECYLVFTVLCALASVMGGEGRHGGEGATSLLFWVWTSAQTRKTRHRAGGTRLTTQPHKRQRSLRHSWRPRWETWSVSRVVATHS